MWILQRASRFGSLYTLNLNSQLLNLFFFSIVTAFVLDMFMYEYSMQKDGKVDSTVEKKIKELGLGIDADT